MYPKWIWRTFALPGVVWLAIFFVVPFYAVVAVSFGTFDEFFQAVPYWNPLTWNIGWYQEILQNIGPGEIYGRVLLRTLGMVGLAVALSLALGYPVAYYVARKAGRMRGPLLLAIVLPFWISYLMRMFAWIGLLADDGYVTRILAFFGIDNLFRSVGLLEPGAGWLDGQWISVVIALVYGYVPFLILPIFAAIDRIDQRLIEAARDLGASPRGAFVRVTWPLSRAGVLGGIVLIALPMFGDYYTNDLVSQSPATNMIGNQIDQAVRIGTQKPLGAALTMVLSLLLAILMIYYLRETHRSTREALR
jgi:ABC-type spermidine/putrescine transport system permease subunit I